MDETYQYMTVKGVSNPKIAAFIEQADLLYGPPTTGVAKSKPRESRRVVLRHSMVQTASVHVEPSGDSPGLHETLVIPPRLISTTSAKIVGTAVINIFEKVICSGKSILDWIREGHFEITMVIVCADMAAYNGLFFKMFRSLQWILMPLFPLLLHLEYCGLHIGVRSLVGQLDRSKGMRKVLASAGSTLKMAKYHDRLVETIPGVVRHMARYSREAPPDADLSCHPDVKSLLMEFCLLATRQMNGDPDSAAMKEVRFHVDAIFKLLNYSLNSEHLWHFCNGCCKDSDDFCRKLTYHITKLLDRGPLASKQLQQYSTNRKN
jgi:hypothetical protein